MMRVIVTSAFSPLLSLSQHARILSLRSCFSTEHRWNQWQRKIQDVMRSRPHASLLRWASIHPVVDQPNPTEFDEIRPEDFSSWTENEQKQQTLWEKNYTKLKKFYHEHGHTVVDRSHNKNLADWVGNQRKLLTKKIRKEIVEYRLQKLKAVNFFVHAQEKNWMEMFEELKAYKAAHGDTLVPRSIYSPQQGLAIWVDSQRREHRRRLDGRSHAMTDERINLLEEVGFEWNVWDARWHAVYEELKEHVHIYGPGQCPTPAIRDWIRHQRTYYKAFLEGKTVPLTAERLQKLRSLGFFLDC